MKDVGDYYDDYHGGHHDYYDNLRDYRDLYV